MNYFHFTLGPVQGFVSQARRTRDFWAGSFLLSWLSGVAMAATEQMGGKITFPIPAEGYLDWIRGNGKGDAPRQGSIPNRFKASVPVGFDGKLVEQAVREAWVQLAEHIWQQDLKTIASPATRAVWGRQNAAFWEISWAITDDVNASNLLDRRKNWRNHLPPPEPGVKCVIMEGWQELSGIENMKKEGNDARRAFWEKVCAIQPAGATDFAEGEMLCALAFVKRRFARHFAGFVGRVLTRQSSPENVGLKPDLPLELKGWKLDTGMPSVAYMAAVHWLEQMLLRADKDAVAKLLDAGKKLAGNDEWDVRIKCLDETVTKQSWNAAKRKVIALDGNVFFEHTRGNAKFYPDQKSVAEFEKILKSLELKDKAPTPFYAVLMMDGDSLGTQMSNPDNQGKIATSLNEFTKNVEGVVQAHNGFLIYAGGDDVLALLPLEDALPCALACRKTYMAEFKKHGQGISTTLSGAVIYAHVKTALGEVLRQAHHVLDDEAKEGAGRDAIAIRVLKPSGDKLTWAQPWEIALDGEQIILENLIADFQNASGAEGQFSSKFFYRMRERFTLLGDGFSKDQQVALLAADYVASEPAKRLDPVSGKQVKISIEEAKQIIGPLLVQCTPRVRVMDKDKKTWESKPATADAALLVRFLAHKGVETR